MSPRFADRTPRRLGVLAATVLISVPAVAEAARPERPADRRVGWQPVALELSPVLVPMTSGDTPTAAGLAGALRLGTNTWRVAYWTLLVLGGGAGGTGDGGVAIALFGVSELGLPLHFGADAQVSVRLGLGLGYAAYQTIEAGGDLRGSGFAFSPTLRAEYQLFEQLFVGVGLRALVAVNNDGGGFLFTCVTLGWSRPGG
ncbi:MAG: hypothetical protein KC933_34205 [Myxococcales bacterium]|nr:hypothetical protein [Myxococcales bacterium]